MRSSLFALLPLVTLALASPFEQIPLSGNVGFNDVPADFELDLNEMRLVQMENQEPVWMSERDKVRTRTLQLLHDADAGLACR